MKMAAKTVMQRIEALARISEEPHRLTRTYGSDAMRRANELVASWMREAGMTVRQDAIGNLIGHYAGATTNSKVFLLGSHLDTVRDAGKFDGPLGVITAIACVQHLHDQRLKLPFAIEVIGFCDEEGVRFQSTYLGSKVLAGTFEDKHLRQADANGVTLADAIRRFGGDPCQLRASKLNNKNVLGYAEVHIEQGPVLEDRNLSVGVVTAIAGQTRIRATFTGRAGHAGTTPMNLRRDALCAAAQFVSAVEAYASKTHGLVATVGQLNVQPGASNVIPGETTLTLDVRHASDAIRRKACAALKEQAISLGRRRSIGVTWKIVHEASAVACDQKLTRLLSHAAQTHQKSVIALPSGAGHDAAAIAAIAPVSMLFVRCKGGISHHPDESAKTADVAVAIAVMNDFLQLLAREFSA